MASSVPFDGVPPVLLSGSQHDADSFLVAALWGRSGNCLPLSDVMEWTAALHGRGEEFASHVAACSYWLYEHAANSPELLRAWDMEQRARVAVSRSAVALQRQRALVDSLVRRGVDASRARAVLESMKWTLSVFADVWAMRAAALERMARSHNRTMRIGRTSISPLTMALPGESTFLPLTDPERDVGVRAF